MTTPAHEIYRQLGNKCFAMLGAKNFSRSKDGNELTFQIRGCRKINYIRVRYNYNIDLYNMSFEYCSLKKGINVIATHDGIYADMMHKLIEQETRLRTSIELVRG